MPRLPLLGFVIGIVVCLLAASAAGADFRAGAAVIDVSPNWTPIITNGGMLSRSVNAIKTRVHARAIALADSSGQAVIIVVDSCMMDRKFLDEVKALATQRTGIPADRILISATHTHTAPASMGALGTDPDAAYPPFLREKLLAAIAAAQTNLEPAQIGFARGNAAEFTGLRQWIRRPDKLQEDPFGNKSIRANMHAGNVLADVTGEAGPEDPELSLISIQARDGRPIAVLANYSMHYFSDAEMSADYFGVFSEELKNRLGSKPVAGKPPFVGIMSHGCSGDIHRRDYRVPKNEWPQHTIEQYSAALVDIALKAHAGIRYRLDADVAMAEQRLPMKYRVPDRQRLEWAQRVVAAMGERRLPKDRTEVYAREQIILHERQETEIVVQALRVGDIGIATTPTETYAITGLRIKAASPLAQTMVIELANGGDGYVPPPEMYAWGGYNTWAARTAGLQVDAEPRIVESAITLLEKVTGQPRRNAARSVGPAAAALLALKPAGWWRLDEFTGPHAVDASGNNRDAVYERDVAYYLEGARSDVFCRDGETNRSVHLVGGRIRARMAGLGDRYSVSLWLYNGMPNDARDVSGWFFSRDRDHALGAFGDHLGIGGTAGSTGRIIFQHGNSNRIVAAGKTEVPRWQWQHVVFVRDGQKVRVYLNGALEIETQASAVFPSGFEQCFFGGRSDLAATWEGRIDEIAMFTRPLSPADVSKLQVK